MPKRTKPNKHGVKYCQFGKCSGKNVDAKWTTSGFITPREYACEEHKTKLTEPEDDSYMTEADYQTWGRLK